MTKEDKSFQTIMKCYRTQHQANSNVRKTGSKHETQSKHKIKEDNMKLRK